MPETFRTQRRIEFRDTDAAGIMHFSVYFTMMEQAEHAWLRELGTSVVVHDEQGVLSWPRVAAHCDYRAPLRFEDEVEIAGQVQRLGDKSVTYRFEFSCRDRLVAEGTLTAVCCRIVDDRPHSVPIPAEFADKLRHYVIESA